MGSVTYDFLADSLFFHQDSINNGFKNENNERIEKELQSYRTHCINNYNTLISEIKNRNSFLKVFSSTEEISIDLLKQTALYVDQFIVADPMFALTDFSTEISKIATQNLGYENEGINKTKLTTAASFLKNITPMIVGNFVKIFPLNYHFESPKEIILKNPINHYNEILPVEILNFFRKNVSVSSLEKCSSGGWLVKENQLYPCRGIIVEFKETQYPGLVCHLSEPEIIEYDEISGKITFREILRDHPPEQEYFNSWVNQSVNSASKAIFDRVFKESLIASNLNSTYLCNDSISSDLISMAFDTKETIQTYTASQFINIEVPFMENIDIQKLMTIRELDADVFTNFRLEVEKQFRELRTITDPAQLKLKTENIFHELNEVQGQKIKLKMNHLKKQMGVNAALLFGGLIGSVQLGGGSLLASAVAIGKGYKEYCDYNEKVRENPAYLLWKIKK